MSAEDCTYQLYIQLIGPSRIVVGRLGCFDFAPGRYVYTGSAKRSLEARLRRHLSRDKVLRWHIDYLLACPKASIIEIKRSNQPECAQNQQIYGQIPVAGFGASDCRAGCGSHLKYLGGL